MGKMLYVAVLALCLTGGAMARGEQVDNPAYASWAACKIGTTVTHKQTMQITFAGMNAPLQIEMVITQTLQEIKAEAITVEVTTAAVANGQPAPSMSQPAKKTLIAAKIEKGVVDVPADIPASQVKDVKAGKEAIEVAGKKYEATTVEFTQAGSGGLGPDNTELKVWSAADVPGRLIKMEGHGKAPDPSGFKVTKTLVEVKGN